MDNKKETFVYGGVEVIKTGRTATRSTSRKKIIIIEIKPAESDINSMNQWVKEDDLYKIEG